MNVNPENDSPDNKAPTGDELSQVSSMVEEIENLGEYIKSTEAELSTSKASLLQKLTESLPNLMESLGISKFTTYDGASVEVKALISGSIPTKGAIDKERDSDEKDLLIERRANCFSYLEDHNAEAIIKREVKASLGPESAKLEGAIKEALEALGVASTSNTTVHPSSLSSWIRERLAAGSEVDQDLFKVFNGRKATIKRKK